MLKKSLIFLLVSVSVASLAVAHQPAPVLNQADMQILYGSFQVALDKSPTSQATAWVNQQSGVSGSTIPLRTYHLTSGVTCRDYLVSVQNDKVSQQVTGTACKTAAGYWKILQEEPVQRYLTVVKASEAPSVQQGCPWKRFSHPQGSGQAVFPHGGNHSKSRYHNWHDFHGKISPHEKQRFNGERQPETKPEQRIQLPSKLIKLVNSTTDATPLNWR